MLADLESLKRSLEEADAVIHYEPDTEQGFFYVPRQEGDTDMIHKPARVTRARRAAE